MIENNPMSLSFEVQKLYPVRKRKQVLKDFINNNHSLQKSTTVRVDRLPVKIIAVQYSGGYYCAFFHRSGSKFRYFSIGVLGGHAAHLSMMSQK